LASLRKVAKHGEKFALAALDTGPLVTLGLMLTITRVEFIKKLAIAGI
jgi:hypothetical protein